jgi:hypothetical protein
MPSASLHASPKSRPTLAPTYDPVVIEPADVGRLPPDFDRE